MIDNPLENQVMEENDNLFINEKYEEHCADRAKELAEINNLNPDYYEPFIEFYIEECRESDRGYFFLMINILLISGGIIIKIYMKLKHLMEIMNLVMMK